MPAHLAKLLCRDSTEQTMTVYLPLGRRETLPIDQRVAKMRVLGARRMLFPAWQRWRLYPAGMKKVRFQIDFLWRLNLLLSSGISLSEALEYMLDKNCHFLTRSCIFGLLLDLNRGKNFAQALGRLNLLFSPRSIELLRHAERTGQLTTVLEKMNHHDEWMLNCTRQVLRAMLYPAILLGIMYVIGLVLILLVLPGYAQLMIDNGQLNPNQPPWWWRWSKAIGQPSALTTLVLSTLLVVGLIWHKRHHILTWLPATRKLQQAQQLHLFEFMYEAGIHLPDIITALSDSEKYRRTRRQYREISRLLERGSSLSEAFTRMPVLPPLALTLLRTGENSGRLGFAARQAASCLEREASHMMKSFEQWLTPVCLLTMGSCMAWMFSSLMGSLYQLVPYE